MRIIVLQGWPGRGKTSTINLLYFMLIPPDGNGNLIERRPYGGDPNDFIAVVLWNGLRIGILSMGDQSTPIAREITNFNNQACDLVICALSTNTPKVRANNALNQFNTTRIDKTTAPNAAAEFATNTADAQRIFNMI